MGTIDPNDIWCAPDEAFDDAARKYERILRETALVEGESQIMSDEFRRQCGEWLALPPLELTSFEKGEALLARWRRLLGQPES